MKLQIVVNQPSTDCWVFFSWNIFNSVNVFVLMENAHIVIVKFRAIFWWCLQKFINIYQKQQWTQIKPLRNTTVFSPGENIIHRYEEFSFWQLRLKPFNYWCYEAKTCYFLEWNFVVQCVKSLLEVYQDHVSMHSLISKAWLIFVEQAILFNIIF